MLGDKLRVIKNIKRDEKKQIIYVNLENIKPNPYQPRKKFDKASLDELAESIKRYGVIQPVAIRHISCNMYELVSGERRLRASKIAGLKNIPSIVLDINDDDLAVMALIENLQRDDLTYIEEAEGYNDLLNGHGLTQEELAIKIGRSQSTIANKIRLLKLPPLVKKILMDNDLTERHARSLLKLHDEQLQLKVLKHVCDRGLNVKKTEELVEKVIDKCSIKPARVIGCGQTKAIKDIRIFINTIKQAVDFMKRSGVNARAAQIDRGEYFEFIIRIAK